MIGRWFYTLVTMLCLLGVATGLRRVRGRPLGLVNLRPLRSANDLGVL